MALLSVMQLTLSPGVVYAAPGNWLIGLRWVLALADVMVAGVAVAEWLGRERWVTMVFWGAVGLLILARLLTLLASPSPYIDVFTLTNQASGFLLGGHNPYTQTYTDLYNGLYDYPPGPNYWPAYYLWSAVFRAAGDIRLGAVVADGVVAVCLPRVLASLNIDKALGRWAVLAWLAFPVSLYVLEQAWIEPVLAMLMLLVLWAFTSKRWLVAGVLLGIAAAFKQYMPLVTLFTLIVAWRNTGRQNILQTVLWAGGTFAVIMLPFIVAAPQAFFDQTLTTYFTRAPRLDGLSVPAWLANEYGLMVNTVLMLLLYVAAVGVGGWVVWRRPTPQGWAVALVVALGGLFIFGRQAFCNYYFLLSFILLLAGSTGATQRATHF
jgi:hypothetical protein